MKYVCHMENGLIYLPWWHPSSSFDIYGGYMSYPCHSPVGLHLLQREHKLSVLFQVPRNISKFEILQII